MKVAGFGFRKGAGADSLAAALHATGETGVTHLATVAAKATAPCLTELARTLSLPICAVRAEDLKDAEVATQSVKSQKLFGTGSLSEAAALLAAGAGARLTKSREISPDSMATCAIAEGNDP